MNFDKNGPVKVEELVDELFLVLDQVDPKMAFQGLFFTLVIHAKNNGMPLSEIIEAVSLFHGYMKGKE